MAKISKNYKLKSVVVECIERIKEDEGQGEKKLTQTDVVERAVFHYYSALYGEKALGKILLGVQ